MPTRVKIVDGKYESAVALVSGGMDSAVCAALAARECRSVVFLHVSYGQRTLRKERDCARELAAHFQTKIVQIEMPLFACIKGSALTDRDVKVPEGGLRPDRIPVTYVPFRNANLLAAAVSTAEAGGAAAIYIGAVEEDSSGYPDCREDFFRSFQRAVDLGTKPETRIAIETPVIHLSKSEIIRLGVELDVPFELTWSCYQDEDRACGKCDSCLLRLSAFKEAGLPDPLPYRL